MKEGLIEGVGMKGIGQVLGSEHWSEVVRICTGIATISLFAVKIPTTSQIIQLGSELSRTEADNHIEATKELRPANLTAGEETDSGKIFQIFVVHYYICG